MVIWLRRSSHLEKAWLVSTKRKDDATTTRKSYGIKEGKVTKDEALKLAMDWYGSGNQDPDEFMRLILSIVAQPEQEPVAWIYKGEKSFDGNKYSDEYELTASKQVALWKDKNAKPLYITPPQRTWVGLTDEEAMQICVDCGCLSEDWLTLLDAIEAKLKEKNT